MAELKPCPFCNCEPFLVDDLSGAYVACAGCGTEGPTCDFSRSEAISAWNTRQSAQEASVDGIAAAIYGQHAEQYDTLNLPTWDELPPLTAMHWRKLATAALQAALSPIAGVTHGTDEGWGDECFHVNQPPQ